MRTSSLVLGLLVFCGCSFQASCGKQNLNVEKAREWLRTTLDGNVGAKSTDVTCPDKVPMKKDTTFECTVSFGTAKATVTILQDNDEGHVVIKSVTGLVISNTLEKLIAERLGEKLNVHVTASCGERVRQSTPGMKFECTATDAKGKSGKVAVTVKDTDGNVDLQLVGTDGPPPAEAPATP